MELVLMRLLLISNMGKDGLKVTHLQISQLSELFATVIKLACEGFDLKMDNLVRTNVAPLSECLATNVATIWSLSSMSPLMCLRRSVGALDEVYTCSHLKVA